MESESHDWTDFDIVLEGKEVPQFALTVSTRIPIDDQYDVIQEEHL